MLLAQTGEPAHCCLRHRGASWVPGIHDGDHPDGRQVRSGEA
eukprot:CAMPEP_0168506064 /NCGR_PEP_ID=MMETSP0228-20121227/77185_1 /TAXON_ID=133427 /ORGANISM="Protoceratium reticulatum, Strain CCCM 535 (=CCMP 1889)" /LENGTH=41 /DNA_ID= /DNA_START= /DNA_END= /DNA_ORIENTATION=